MKKLNKQATEVFAQLITGLKDGYCKIENAFFMPLTIEKIGQAAITGLGNTDLYSLCHYYIQNGDLMQDPEMCFMVIDNRTETQTDLSLIKIIPYMYVLASIGVFEESVTLENNEVKNFNLKQQADHAKFANRWLINIKQQGFLDIDHLKCQFNFQINTDRRSWDEVPVRSKWFENRIQAVKLAYRVAKRYTAEVRLTEGTHPFTTSGSYFSHTDL
ncbi:hypothetical protein ABIE26_002975 [Pedobacter africanus]|uniref:DUF6908 domain-containing protein n=1 Tax=Pedobacter africanus TaxID=151894 RepID=UPI0033909EBA